jgi:hypothetical protein
MKNIKFRTITDKNGIENVLDIVERYSGVRLPTEYANRNKVVGAFLQDKLVATYMVITKPDFRSLMFVPSDNWKKTNLSVTDDYDMMEINGLWISPALIKDIFMSKKKYVLLMRDSRNKIMERFLNMANPTTLYDGPPMLMAGATSHEKIQVSFTTRWGIILNCHKYVGEIRSRMKRAKEFEKARSYSAPVNNNAATLAQPI